MKKLFQILILLLPLALFSQEKKQLAAVRITVPPLIDGSLDDDAWRVSSPGTGFIQREPNPFVPASMETEVRVVYDNFAIYIGARMKDVSRDSVLRELGRRDTEGNTDVFGIFLDTYNDDLNAFGFFVTAAGVQLDGKYSSQGQDLNWNAVWESEVKIYDDGWVAEFKIPYSAIRFATTEEQTWGINFIRKIRRTRENTFWNPVDPSKDGLVFQSGDLTGIKNIESPLRLSVTPYVAGYIENYPYNQKGKSNNSYSVRGGMDLKYGISESFTLDMTVVPDFGQVQSDNEVLNLTPFEVMYDEKRPFFTEGTELFNRGNLFYSRRVGGKPLNYDDVYAIGDDVVENPEETQLINASKISGRTRKNTGIGFFNATSAETYAVLKDSTGKKYEVLTSPLTNYNVFVIDQALKNNSYFNIINTNVTRNGSPYDANLTCGMFRLLDKKSEYFISGKSIISQKYFSNREAEFGKSFGFELGKSSGQWQWAMSGQMMDDKYDPNDLGILFINNTVDVGADLKYNIYKPFWKVNNLFSTLHAGYSRMYYPSEFWNFNIYGESWTTFTKKYLSVGAWFNIEPILTYDWFEPRVPLRYYTYPVNAELGYWFSSDYRKKFALDGRMNYRWFDENNRFRLNLGLTPRFRATDKLSFIYDVNRDNFRDDIGYATNFSDTVIFGRRSVQTIWNTLEVNYIFNHHMSLSFRTRHYWSKAKYLEYYFLDEEGMLKSTTYTANHDINFNAFNIDMVYIWQFAPGSEMSIVWKNAILTREQKVVNAYFENVNTTFDSPQTNSISIKILYYLDFLRIKKNK